MEFETEEQHAEAVKKWFKEYGLTIVLGLVIGMGGVYGYRYYETEQEAGFEQASVARTRSAPLGIPAGVGLVQKS